MLYCKILGEKPTIKAIHLGGGTPTFFSTKNLEDLINGIFSHANKNTEYEFSFEGHPNNTSYEHLQKLYDLGFRRVSFGVQDYSEKVQKAIHREQPFHNVAKVTFWAREIGYTSIGHDIIFGLPYQEIEDVIDTIEKTKSLQPDRLAFYSYAHVPWIKDGICKLTKLSANGKDHIVKLVTKGELLGQRSMISNEPVNLSAVALEDMQVCFIPKSEVMGYFDKNNQFSMNVMKTICGDLKEADDHMVNLAQKTVKERLAETLLYLNDTFGKNKDNSLKIQLSRDELSSIIGTATESCIRLLSDFKKLGLIELTAKKIILKDINALKKLAE